MKVKVREDVYRATPTKCSTCVSCAFLSDNGGICNAPNFIYESCVDCYQVFHHSKQCFKIFDL